MPRLLPILFLSSILASAGGIAAGCGSSNGGGGSSSGSDAAADTSPVMGGGDSASSADVAAEAAAYPAFVPTDIPQVVTRGGAVLALPKVVPIYFAEDDPAFTPKITDFLSKVGATMYWNTIAKEYGVGSLTSATPIQLGAADNPPALYADVDIETWLDTKLGDNGDAGADPAFPAPDGNTVYALFFPAQVTITQGGGGGPPPGDGGAEGGVADGGGGGGGGGALSCQSFGGYHSAFQLNNGTNVAYAVIPRCANFDGFTGIDAVTAAASHELVEAVTDPFLSAFAGTDQPHRYFGTVLGGGGEIGDMCAQSSGSFTHFPELPAYVVQRCWSNKAALTGGDPCVPIPQGNIYFNSIPAMPDVLQIMGRAGADGGATVTPTKGVQIAVGASKTIELDLFSDAPTPSDWNVTAFDSSVLNGGAPELQFSFDKSSGHNGDKLHMTIKVLVAGRRNNEPFLILSTMGSSPSSPNTVWAGVVGN